MQRKTKAWQSWRLGFLIAEEKSSKNVRKKTKGTRRRDRNGCLDMSGKGQKLTHQVPSSSSSTRPDLLHIEKDMHEKKMNKLNWKSQRLAARVLMLPCYYVQCTSPNHLLIAAENRGWNWKMSLPLEDFVGYGHVSFRECKGFG